MVNIALCGDIPIAGGDVRDIILRCAQRIEAPTPTIHPFASSLELLERLDNPMAEPLFDLIVINVTLPGMSGIQTVRDARATAYRGEIVLIENTESHALEAQRLHVEEYWVIPVDAASAEQGIAIALRRLYALDAESTTIRMREGARKVPFAQLVYAQTANHDQVLHMRDGSTMSLRCSSQELFDRLAHDTRFLKLGSSYIVNLDLVRSFNSNAGALSFVEGSTASVPVRFRRVVQDALFERAERRKYG